MRKSALLAAAAVIGASAALTLPAQAAPTRPHWLHAVENRSGHAQHAAARGSGTSNLVYHGGPVLHTSKTYAIFWQPPGTTVSADYQALIERFFGDVGGTQLYDVLTQYGDSSGPTLDQSSFGGAYTDTTAFPGSRGSVSNPLTDTDVTNAVDRALNANPAWKSNGGATPMYFVFMPLGVYQSYAPGQESFLQYCAYHGSYTSSVVGGTTYYASMPDAGTNLAACGVQSSVTPNGDPAADSEISTTSHEEFETVNDPLGTAWWDSSGEEIGDKCAYIYGSEAADGGNTTLDGHRYITQMEWSNGDGGCVIHFPALLGVAAPSSASAGTPVTVTVTARDGGGHTATGYIGSVTLTSTDPTVTARTYTFTAADAGTHAFSVTLATSGPQTITASDAVTGITGSATITVGSGSPPPTNAIVNGGFETGSFAPWTTRGAAAIVTSPVHSGTHAALAGSTSPSSATSSISQTFTIPGGATSLTFWSEIVCNGRSSRDYATAVLRDNSTGRSATVMPRTCSSTGAFAKTTVSLSGYSGHSVTLTLSSSGDGHATSYAYFDDAATS